MADVKKESTELQELRDLVATQGQQLAALLQQQKLAQAQQELDEAAARKPPGGWSADRRAELEEMAAMVASATHRLGKHENPNYIERTVYNPTGSARPTLNGTVYFVGVKLEVEQMTDDEIRLTNLIQPGVYARGAWRVVDKRPGINNPAHRVIEISVPCDFDTRGNYPSYVWICEQILKESALTAPA